MKIFAVGAHLGDLELPCGGTLAKAIQEADDKCGSCGCEWDKLYKRALELL